MKDKDKEEKIAIKHRVAEIIQDYLVLEPEEDEAIIAMYFRKGNEEQEKIIRFNRSCESFYPENDILKSYGLKTLDEFTEHEKEPWYKNL